MRHRMRHGFVTTVMVAGLVGGLVHSTTASAEPDSELPVPPGLFHLNPAIPVPPAPAGQNPTPYVGQPVFAPPTFNPVTTPAASRAVTRRKPTRCRIAHSFVAR